MVTTRHGVDTSSPAAFRPRPEQYAGVDDPLHVKKRSLDGDTLSIQNSPPCKRRLTSRSAHQSSFTGPTPDNYESFSTASALEDDAGSIGQGRRAPEHRTSHEVSPLAETSIPSTSQLGRAISTRKETEEDVKKSRVRVLDIEASANALTSHEHHDPEPRASQIALASKEPRQKVAHEVIEIGDDSDDDSDDGSGGEAPEAIGLSAAKAQIRAQAAAASVAIKMQESRGRKSRQERAVRLREQVEASDRRMKQKNLHASDPEQERGLKPHVEQPEAGRTASVDMIDEIIDIEHNHMVAREQESGGWAGQSFDLNNLPALLPAELLETEAPVRSPTPPSDAERKGSTTRTKHLSLNDKYRRAISLQKRLGRPAPDIVRGPVNVSVLPRRSTLLAPQAENRSKELRNYWLKGRPSMLHESKGPRAASNKFAKKGRMERRIPFMALKQKFA